MILTTKIFSNTQNFQKLKKHYEITFFPGMRKAVLCINCLRFYLILNTNIPELWFQILQQCKFCGRLQFHSLTFSM